MPKKPYGPKLTKELAHNRTAVAQVLIGNCDVCHTQNVQTFCVDTSDQEYGDFCICWKCLVRQFHIEPAPQSP